MKNMWMVDAPHKNMIKQASDCLIEMVLSVFALCAVGARVGLY